ncbi:hypothetical protein GJ496_010416 [Pomphorhynchus laevis]|nr:hypothetical protein GJ496_010416 [Pomphorhynchus laevis]
MLVQIILVINLFKTISSKCITYGQCGTNEYGYSQNCLYDGPPKALNNTDVIRDLKVLCPWYFKANSNDTLPLCCDSNQAKTLVSLAQLPQLIVGRCPACWRNLRTLMCERACSPEISNFEAVTNTVSYIDSNGKEHIAVNKTNLVINYDYMDSIMQSCSEVKFMGSSALYTICQSSECTPQLLAEALSSIELGSPHRSDIFLSNQNEETVDGKVFLPLKQPTYECRDAIITEDELELGCACSDCPKSCSELNFAVPVTNMIGVLTITEILIIGLALTVVLAAVAIILHNVSQIKSVTNIKDGKIANIYWRAQYKISKWLYAALSDGFYNLGIYGTTYPIVTCIISLLACVILTLGLTHFEPTADPVQIWGLIGGRCLKEKDYFDQHFGPFYRTTQVILVPKNQTNVEYKGKLYGPVFRQSIVLELLEIQTAINNLAAVKDGEFIRLSDVCFVPLSPENPNCAVQDVAQYFQNDKNKIMQNSWMDHLLKCTDSYYSVECLSPYLAPIFPYVAFAGVPNKNDYKQSTALTITILNNNFLDTDKLNKVRLWEAEFLNYMKQLKSDQLELYFNSERSAEDGVTDVSQADVSTIIVSYIVMFVYMSVFLSTFRGFSTILTDVRITLGFACIFMIILSVTSSFGFFAFLGYKTTLIVLEVTPFLILAIGCGDNFIFIKNFVTYFSDSNDPIELKVASNLRQIGPSLLLSSSAQFVAFCIGSIIPVASVRMFALYSAMAVLIKFCLQVTFFVAFFTLDCKRMKSDRFDIFCCFKHKSSKTTKKAEIYFHKLFKKIYSPILLHKITRPIVMIAFLVWFVVSLVFIPRIEIGLNLEIIFPDNSYTREYLAAVAKYSAVGPPIYFVVRDGYLYSNLSSQNGICASVGCDPLSIINQASQAATISNITHIETAPTSWIDDYFSWISSQACCTINITTNELCPADSSDKECVACPTEQKPFNNRPKPYDFDAFLLTFLERNPDEYCPKAGKALFSSAVEIYRMKNNSIGATNFMAYSSIQRTTSDSYRSLEATRHLSDILSDYLINELGFKIPNDGLNSVFIYSMVHVFYEQYLGISHMTIINLIYSVSSLTVLITLILTIGQLMGSMYFANVELNAISVVNLIMSVGIAVEFYVHMIRDFSITKGENSIDRAKSISNHIGVFIFIGVTIPELVSVSTMSTANSELFRVYFFKMYLILILTCTFNGLVFLPVFLSYFGSPLNEQKLNIINDEFKARHSNLVTKYTRDSTFHAMADVGIEMKPEQFESTG